MLKILFKVVEATSDFSKAISDFIEEAQIAYPDLDVEDVNIVPFAGKNTVLKLVMKDDSAADHAKGGFATLEALNAAYPIAELGDWAVVGSTDTIWVWDVESGSWVDTGMGALVSWGGISGVLSAQADLQGALDAKQDSEAGKGLSTEDYTTTEQTKLSGIAESANNYTHPANHLPSIITQDLNNRFVTDIEKGVWNGKQDALGYTAEDVVNKKTILADSDTEYPTSKAVNIGLAGKENSLGFTPENVANKKTTITNSDTEYPTGKAVGDALALKASTASVINEILPVEIFEDGVVPPAELDILDGFRYRDFSINDDMDLNILKLHYRDNPVKLRLAMLVTAAVAPALNETIIFEVLVNDGGPVTFTYTGFGTEVQGDLIYVDIDGADFGAVNYDINVKRVTGTYSEEIGLVAVEVA